MGKIYEHIITCILLQIIIKKSVKSFANVNAILQSEMSPQKILSTLPREAQISVTGMLNLAVSKEIT